MRGPLPEEGVHPEWAVLKEMFQTGQRFSWEEVAAPASAAVNDDIKAWKRHTWEILQKFSELDAYSLLSQKLLKFYKELHKTAAMLKQQDTADVRHDCYICRRKQLAASDLIVSRCL